MNASIVKCPRWLAERLSEEGGSVSFHQFMDWALNDHDYGAYGTGHLKIGRKGDFCTSPSLGDDFAKLLAVQVIDWFVQLEKVQPSCDLFSLVEIGPGEGSLALDLVNAIKAISPRIYSKIEVMLVEPNRGMRTKQKEMMGEFQNIRVRWLSINELKTNPVIGVVIANEVLDALPVERVVFKDNNIYRLGVTLLKRNNMDFLTLCELESTKEILNFIDSSESSLGVELPPKGAIEGWCTEWHCDVEPWFKEVSSIINKGVLLVIDYALESKRYYSLSRSSGTIISYQNQIADSNVLKDVGFTDITTHLCLENLIFSANKNGLKLVGETRQGQALLALGLSQLLYSLQSLASNQLSLALEKRESLLRLVDPLGLGEFRWICFQKGYQNSRGKESELLRTIFLEEPID